MTTMPEWVQVGAQIIHNNSRWSDFASVETITRKTDKSVWTKSHKNGLETRWVPREWGSETVLERYGDRYGFSYSLDSDTGRSMKQKSDRAFTAQSIKNLMQVWEKSPNDENSMKLRQALATWEVKYAAKAPPQL